MREKKNSINIFIILFEDKIVIIAAITLYLSLRNFLILKLKKS